MGRLDGRVAVITGGASGMGEAATRLFVREGARVVIGDVQKDKAEALAAGLDGRAVARAVDVSRAADVKALVDTARVAVRPARHHVQQRGDRRRRIADSRNAGRGVRPDRCGRSEGRVARHQIRGAGHDEGGLAARSSIPHRCRRCSA